MKERILGITDCLLDLMCQVFLSFAALFRKEPEWDVTDNIYHDDNK